MNAQRALATLTALFGPQSALPRNRGERRRRLRRLLRQWSRQADKPARLGSINQRACRMLAVQP